MNQKQRQEEAEKIRLTLRFGELVMKAGRQELSEPELKEIDEIPVKLGNMSKGQILGKALSLVIK